MTDLPINLKSCTADDNCVDLDLDEINIVIAKNDQGYIIDVYDHTKEEFVNSLTVWNDDFKEEEC